MPAFFSKSELEVIEAACEQLIPADPDLDAPGARAATVARYIDQLLGAFTFDPPRIWAGGPFSGRHGGEPGFENFSPLRPLDELAWRIRIEGSRGLPEREFNGPVIGWQEQYRAGLAELGRDFARVSVSEREARLDVAPAFKSLLYSHACEGMYGDPVYGGNNEAAGWRFIAFDGDVQPRGYAPDEVTAPEARR